jgi:hypothetical protein
VSFSKSAILKSFLLILTWLFAARFRKIFSDGCHVALCSAGDANGPRFRRAREWAVAEAFAGYEFENRGQERDPSGFHFSDQRTGAVAFHRDPRFG